MGELQNTKNTQINASKPRKFVQNNNYVRTHTPAGRADNDGRAQGRAEAPGRVGWKQAGGWERTGEWASGGRVEADGRTRMGRRTQAEKKQKKQRTQKHNRRCVSKILEGLNPTSILENAVTGPGPWILSQRRRR